MVSHVRSHSQPAQPLQFLLNLCGFPQPRQGAKPSAGRANAAFDGRLLPLRQGIHSQRIAIELTCASDEAVDVHDVARPGGGNPEKPVRRVNLGQAYATTSTAGFNAHRGIAKRVSSRPAQRGFLESPAHQFRFRTHRYPLDSTSQDVIQAEHVHASLIDLENVINEDGAPFRNRSPTAAHQAYLRIALQKFYLGAQLVGPVPAIVALAESQISAPRRREEP